jgi:ribosomal protein L11
MFHVKTKVCLFVRSQSAENGPPLGTILGNMGVNAIKFVKDFNDFTKELPSYFLLKVHIYILEDRSYKFSVFLPTTGYILSFIKKFEIFDKIKKKPVISLKNVIQLCLLKFPKISLLKSFPVILGTVNTCGLTIIF